MGCMTDKQLQELHKDIEDGLVIIVEKKHFYALQAENRRQADFLVLAKEQMDAQATENERLKGQADGYCVEYTKEKAENKKLKEKVAFLVKYDKDFDGIDAENKRLREVIEDAMSNKKCSTPTRGAAGCKYRHQSDGCVCCDCILNRLEQALKETQ